MNCYFHIPPQISRLNWKGKEFPLRLHLSPSNVLMLKLLSELKSNLESKSFIQIDDQ